MIMLKNVFKSREFLIGLGLGLIIASLCLWNKKELSDYEIELRAKKMGMKYESDFRAGEVKKDD